MGGGGRKKNSRTALADTILFKIRKKKKKGGCDWRGDSILSTHVTAANDCLNSVPKDPTPSPGHCTWCADIHAGKTHTYIHTNVHTNIHTYIRLYKIKKRKF